MRNSRGRKTKPNARNSGDRDSSRGSRRGSRPFNPREKNDWRRGSENRRGDRSGRDFRPRDGGRGSRDSGRRGPEMHEVICDKCGISCEVPFRPTAGKPVLCRECFDGENSRPRSNDRFSDRSDRSSGRPPSNKQLDEINRKLDRIMKALSLLD